MTKEYKLSDYKLPTFLMTHVDLVIDLSQNPVQTVAKLHISSNPNAADKTQTLILDGQNMQLQSLLLNNKALSVEDYDLNDECLVIKNVPTKEDFIIECTCLLGTNTDLFGLYETENTVLVKAETEGLRRVFYCIDRPDNLASYTTTIITNKTKYPVLLSNGLLQDSKDLENGLHTCTWVDTFPKPSYLFAIVAGQLQRSETEFITKSGKKIPIVFYVPPHATAKCEFAKDVLKRVMAWDEETYQIECDLPQHMIAGVDKYASGASETTGLNLFNTENLFATADMKTDLGIMRVLEVLAHEYCHLLTGNRITIANWFNLTWKEGLTTFRAELFLESLFGEDLVRLFVGKNLDERAPRPAAYTAVRSLYTAAAYEKSAAIFRMISLIMGKKQFNDGLSSFLKKNYGSAVSIENFLDYLTQISDSRINIQCFLPWFTETGIPTVLVSDEYDEKSKQYRIKFKTLNDKNRPIPVVTGLLDRNGQVLANDKILLVEGDEKTFTFDNIQSKPIPSLLRGFSAPVYLQYEYTEDELLILMQFDTNIYNRCEAAKNLINKLVQEYSADKPLTISKHMIETYRALINDTTLSPWLRAEILTLPSEEELIASTQQPNFENIAQARKMLLSFLAQALAPEWKKLLGDLQEKTSTSTNNIGFFDINAAGKRRLFSLVCSYLVVVEPNLLKVELVKQFNESLQTNMTNTTNALIGLCEFFAPEAEHALKDFYKRWQDDTNAINYWFKIQAATHAPQVIDTVKKLMQSPAYDVSNPNKVNALIITFIKNPYGFHSTSGNGYALVAQVIIQLDKINPALAGKLTESFIYWDKYDTSRQKLMLDNLVAINNQCSSNDVKNMAKKGLDKCKTQALPIAESSRLFRSGESVTSTTTQSTGCKPF